MSLVPNLDEFRRLAADANTIPVYREIAADLDTPVSAFLKLHRKGQGFLLESVEGGDRWGRYSLLGSDPLMTLRAKGGSMTVSRRDGKTETLAGDPVDALRKVLAPFKPARVEGLSRFAGGFVGYLSYDLVRTVEKLPSRNVDDLDAADIAGLIADNFVLFDNVTHTMKVVCLAVLGDHATVDDAYASACYSVERAVERLRTTRVPLPTPRNEKPTKPVSNCTPAEYEQSIRNCLEYIAAGDIFQVVVSQRFEAPLATHPFSIYRALRTINPSPYMFYLDLDGEIATGSSPEVMVKVDDGRVTVRPIAGTIRRGATPEEDEALVARMLADPKEQAEHIMLVDLGRNDVGRVADVGSVKVEERMVVERYSHVNHIVSLVSGRLRPGMDCLDAFRATFPAGTLSGAPKVRAMEVIEEAEKTRRGLYGGAVGYVDFFGNLDTCIAIRTVLVKHDKTYVQVGAGIVADSVPEREQAECGEKSAAMMAALAHAAEIEKVVKTALARLVDRQDLADAEMTAAVATIMDGGATAAQIGAFLAALHAKGETVEELVAAVRVMRERAVELRIDAPLNDAQITDAQIIDTRIIDTQITDTQITDAQLLDTRIIDTCGTGGDGLGYFNVSTAAAFVAAAAGAKVAKHGNRAASGKVGAADVLEALGASIELGPDAARRCLERCGITFLFAPIYHPAVRHVAAARRELGFRTLFNLTGPLCNPAGARRQVIGLFSKDWLVPVAETLRRLGSEHVLVVHGGDGSDEITPAAETSVVELVAGEIRSYEIEPEGFGIARCKPSDLAGGDAAENATMMREVLGGAAGARSDATALNAGAAIHVAGIAASLAGGVARAREILRGGEALGVLDAFVAQSRAIE